MSNPTGDDSGREWIEVYNETESDLDLSAMTLSIKGGTFVVATPLQGGATLAPGSYAVIGSTVSGATKFLQDYPSYSGPLFRASISLVNTGVTSIDIKLSGTSAVSLPSYTAAKEGLTLSYIGGSYATGNPTPGAENQVADTPSPSTSATTTENQVTLPQMSPPSADIIIYMPEDKVAVAGAETEFSVFSMTRAGKPINDLRYAWAFGDGGQGTGSSTKYRYVYSGRYIAQVEATSANVSGKGRMVVRVVPPDISIASAGAGKYGTYVEIKNPNTYDLDLSQWTLSIDGAAFPFPRNTLLSAGATTRFSGLAMGFASTTVATSTIIKILFPNLEEVTRFVPARTEETASPALMAAATAPAKVAALPVRMQPKVLGVSAVAKATSTTPAQGRIASKDKRLATWLRSLFAR
jgi:hypothetical protein